MVQLDGPATASARGQEVARPGVGPGNPGGNGNGSPISFDAEPPSRREFLKLLGAGAAFAAAGCARKPVEKVLPYVHAPEELVPGQAVFYASTCGECSAGCGVLAKTREGRPIKLEGNPDHPLNRGALCPRGQASVLNLYDPDRLRGPALGKQGQGDAKAASWSHLDSLATRALQDARARNGAVILLTGTVSSPATTALIRDFLAAYPSGEHVMYDPVSSDAIARAQEISYGTRLIPRYRLDRADVLVTLGADPLGTQLSPVEHARDYWARRRPEMGPMSRVIAIESIVTLTGSNADDRIRVRPDHLYPVAMAIAHELVVARPRASVAADAAALRGFEAAEVERRAGLAGGTIAKIADLLWEARGRSLVMAGPHAAPAAHAIPLQVAANLLNSALGNDGVTVDASAPSRQALGSEETVIRLLERMRAGEIAALLIHGVNPAYSLPAAAGFAEALKRVPFVASLSDRADETARLADVIATVTHYLESWNDHEPRPGVLSLTQPAIAPLYDVRSFQETLLAWGRAVGAGPLAGTSGTWHERLREHWRAEVYPRANAAASFDLFWEGSLRTGVVVAAANGGGSARGFQGGALASMPAMPAAGAKDALQIVLYEPISVGDGRFANNAWLQELPDPVSKICWDNFAALSPARAKALGVGEYEQRSDVITVDVGHAKVDLPVHVQPGLHDDVVGIALGYGRVGNRVGQSGYALAAATGGRMGFSGIPARVSRAGRIAPLAMVQIHHQDEDRPVAFETTYGAFLRDPHSGIEEHHHLPSMWTPYEYKGHKWGMAIDLSTCIGCSACMIACQAENNVPVVGKQVVIQGREMHWIRIDRYYSGDADNPDFVYQPMLCQHCENAPCETVCPVLATVHSSEGLNVQVYNRCVGTRYCSNNCPYKVRRFNWFDYSQVREPSVRLALSPDVTVRSKGVMEKCTFCIQRIRDGKEHAKALGVRAGGDDIKTACQQTCPTDAIVFGDLNDPKSKVAQLAANQRGYHALSELNTRPRVTYQTKVRNQEEGTA
jgi:Fe-S-cluster-containing dehydrogenase component